jgi:uncharacterized NAD(P)/FAD-binding protein YdhS
MDGSAPPPRTLAIIGGGFSGACLALHLARDGYTGRMVIFEPRPVLGLGLAYSTVDDSHRLNARASRMSVYPDDPAHFTRWIAETGACDDDPEAALPDGRLFTRRSVYGAYVAAQVAPLVRDGRVVHVRAEVRELTRRDGAWAVLCGDGREIVADVAVLATGHAPPGVPGALAEISGHEGFIADPLRPGALARIAPQAKVLIVGTGLTMADSVAALTQAGHSGPIIAVSRRGQVPRPHAMEDFFTTVGFSLPATASALVRAVRAAVAAAVAEGLTWQAVFDALRWRAEDLWGPLPAVERRRLVRHIRPFWDTHRHRLPPPTAAVLNRRLAANTLRIAAASIAGVQVSGPRIEVLLRARGADDATREAFDAVILTAGPGRPGQAGDSVCGKLVRNGVLAVDGTGLGFCCDAAGEVPGAQHPPLFVIGPLTRGTFAEIIGVPEIAVQAGSVAAKIQKLSVVGAPGFVQTSV